jgi:hypothetical protein
MLQFGFRRASQKGRSVKTHRLFLLVALVVAASTPSVVPTRSLGEPLQSSDELTNDDILHLVKGGLSSDIVVAKIQRSECRFNTSPSALIQLKSAGVSDGIILAMVKCPTTAKLKKEEAPPFPAQEKIIDAKTAGGAAGGLPREEASHPGKRSMTLNPKVQRGPKPTALDGALGHLTVSANVLWAGIAINGHGEPGWRVPYTFSLPPGAYAVSVLSPGYETSLQRVTVTVGQQSEVRAQLTRLAGVVQIVTDPPDLEVSIDGKSYGKSPILAPVDEGQHRYRVEPPLGRAAAEGSFDVRAGAYSGKRIRY